MTRDSVAGEAGGFVAGTRVRTKEGLKPIEEIEVGDWVLSQPEDRGEPVYKRVTKTFCFEDKSVVLVDFVLQRNGEWIDGDSFIVTGNHPFWVDGVERSLFPEDHVWDASDENRGWTRADLLCYGDIVCLASGERAVITSPCSVEKLWKTKKSNIAWLAKVGDDSGNLLAIDGANVTLNPERVLSEFFHEEESFRYREENRGWQEEWYYRCTVYNFEVEDFHTYYVGDFGVWVHNTNCTTEDAMEAESLKVEGKCFPGDTAIVTRYRGKSKLFSLKEIEVGDYILSRCDVTGEVSYKRVTKLFAHGFAMVCNVGCDYGPEFYERYPNSEAILATAEHLFWVEGKGGANVRNLKQGDEFVTSDGVKATCTGVEIDVFEDEVFSLEVDDFHTYFIGLAGVWVHAGSGDRRG